MMMIDGEGGGASEPATINDSTIRRSSGREQGEGTFRWVFFHFRWGFLPIRTMMLMMTHGAGVTPARRR
ncbi:hypothetical protein HanRHA438_Chr05g0219781 [Helianthus annuus]|uniref:Uncharacterized protein n=1 Tax=Helianthus annuus TaxID=4232 RepID=A0A251UPD5_HELAN|nr:hypothetical protein HanXRQr2_Chr05g0210141 [Helianthus annuus]KAJ0569927.1 hypothetical protein HanHA300_Chr05g0172191 [Helianthus annuus]KAJ0584256.1 hypothetical protein HanHA89_Chr05g0186441 [Helianthus annuus]KAJ0918600.1 hypothetical protein HanRHA438_Chr05g0219781 [Helianthus annuus]